MSRQSATPELVRAALRGPIKARFTTLQLVETGENEEEWRALAYLLFAREHGFMVLLPQVEQVYAALMYDVEGDGDHIVITDTMVALETSRGRLLGEGSVYIADTPWLCLDRFRKFTSKPPAGVTIHGFKCRGALARPVHASAIQAGLAWVKEVLDEETAQEYLTAEELPEEPDVPDGPAVPAEQEEVASLRQRLAQLESLLGGGDRQAGGAQDAAPDRVLFGPDATGQLSSQEWDRLQAAVGAAPKRLARAEPRAKARVTPTDPLELLLEAEADREVVDPDAEYAQLAAEVAAQTSQDQNPMQKLLVLQLKQTSDLVKALLPKTQSDPLSAVLGGSDNASGGSSSGSSGVKGYAARELFLKQIEEEKTVVEHARRNARVELGVAESREEPALMRQGLGTGHGKGQPADAGFLCPPPILCRTELLGQRPHSPVLAPYRSLRAELPVDVRAQEEANAEPIRPAAAGDVGSCKRFLLERCGHVRKQVEKPRWRRQPSISRSREGRQSTQKNQEVEGRKGRRHQCCRQLPSMSVNRGAPEQRSSCCQSSEGKIDSGTYNSPEPDLNSKGFDSFIHYTLSSMIDPVTVLLTSLQWLERVPCSFNIFVSRSFRAVRESRTVEGPMHHRSLWPVPPPLWRWTANPRPGPRQRRRRRKARMCHLLLQKLVCMLNWITLGYPDKPTPAARAGGTCSADQYKVLQNLQRQIDHFSDMASFASQDLGRFGEKFSALKRSSEELPAHLEVDLEDLLQEIHSSLNQYTRFEKPHFADREQFSQKHASCEHEPSKVFSDNVGNKPVIASRIKWKHPPTFDARPYLLDPVVASVYEHPDTLRLPVLEWPQKSKARVHCERSELRKLMKIWDAHGSLALFPTSEIDEHETVGLFAVPKDIDYDRLIVNPTVLNSRMAGYSNFTRKLAPGSLIALLSLESDQYFRFNADDLSDFYYTFRVSRARAKRNAIGVKMFDKDVSDLSCYDPKIPGPYYPALATLAMGDEHAVEIAQGS